MLTLTYLGVGSAFAKRNFQSNALIEAWSNGPDRQESPDDTLLVDFGTTGPLALHALKNKLGFSYLDHDGTIHYPAIRRVFITHQHSDHIGGLEELAGMNTHVFNKCTSGERYKPQLICPVDVLDTLWDRSLRGGLAVLAGRHAELEDYFEVVPLHPPGGGRPDGFTLLDRYEFTAFRTDHIRLRRKGDWPCFGLLITDHESGGTVVYSGDTRFDHQTLGKMMAGAKTIFHDVQLEEEPDSVHALLSELRTLPEPIRQRTYLYHYGDAWDDPRYNYVADEFAGFAGPQRRYTLWD